MSLTLFVNGRKRVFNQNELDPKMSLLQFLRKSGLTGAKLGCGEGGCGACTVMLSSYDAVNKVPVHYSANACLTPVCSLDGIAITTVEGIGSMKEGLHPVQQRISAMHGSQCGYCTPGIVMAIYTFLRANPNATPHEIESSLDGNLCRCTGYRPILDAARSLSNNKESPAPPAGCCKGNGGKCPCAETLKDESSTDSFLHNNSEDSILAGKSLQESLNAVSRSEPIFPPELTHYEYKALEIVSNGSKWFQPITLESLLALKAEYPAAKLIAGNTEVAIEMRLKAFEYNIFVNPSRVKELCVLETTEGGINVGAAVTINGLRSFCGKVEDQMELAGKPYLTRGLRAIKHMLTWFASNHIRNVACVGGNIATASPISDLNPMLLATNAVLTIHSASKGSRQLPIQEFFLAYRKVALEADEILVSVYIPYTTEFEYVLPFKQARRREDDVSIVTAGMRVRLAPKPVDSAGVAGWLVQDATLSFGGMAPTAVQAKATVAELVGRDWSYAAVENVFATMRKELSLPVSVPGGQAEYRMALAVSFLYKCYLTMTAEHGTYVAKLGDEASFPPVPNVDPIDLSATFNFLTEEKTYSRGEQGHFDRQGAYIHTPHTPDNTPAYPPLKESTPAGGVGQSLMHRNAEGQVTGGTKYVDDMPLPANAVHACLVTSTKAHARVLSVDTTEAEKCTGFVKYICAKDVIGSNNMGVIVKDEEAFVTDIAMFYGAVIGAVLADTHEEAVLAARRVVVQYEELTPIVSINDAIAANSFFPTHHSIVSGDLDLQKSQAEVVVEGVGRIGGQEHFYLETNATIALPSENGHMEVFSSTQNIAETQHYCASVCGVPDSKIVAKVKRMGGGFGGKESRSAMFAVVAALGAAVLDRPVSIMIERDVDMSLSGQRHAFQYSYKAGMKKDGTLCYFDVDVYSNGGYSHDLSVPVMDRAIFHIDNVYRWPALSARGNVCKTNQPTHTAYRGFGGPQGMVMTETVMQHLSEASGLPLDFLKTHNMYKDGDCTHFGQPLEHFFVPDLWTKAHRIASVEERRVQVAEFNKNNRWRKRGLAVTPTKFGINFTAKFMNQGGALVHVYTDGSVLLAHGGTEMGQGLFTKVIQVAAQSFGISEQYIITTESATNTVPNASPSAASLSTDLYGMAVLDACEIIKKRLEPVKARLGDCDWPTLVRTAFFDRIDLSAHGFYKIHTDRCGYDWDKVCATNRERGFPFNYYTMGVAVTEVEIDCLTGDSYVLRADVLMDVGKSINPAIDIGQIEGAFVQGYGWSTMEDLIWGDKEHPWVRPGQLFTRGPGTYKIPSFNDVPADFRVHLSDTDNRFAVHSSKAVGEPPFFLGASALFAIKNAILAARSERGFTEYYPLHLPATSERIRMACTDDIAKLCISDAAAQKGVEQFQPLASC